MISVAGGILLAILIVILWPIIWRVVLWGIPVVLILAAFASVSP